jgi:hypothetical protein
LILLSKRCVTVGEGSNSFQPFRSPFCKFGSHRSHPARVLRSGLNPRGLVIEPMLPRPLWEPVKRPLRLVLHTFSRQGLERCLYSTICYYIAVPACEDSVRGVRFHVRRSG